MYRKCKVVMLPTNGKANIQKRGNILGYSNKYYAPNVEIPNQNQHLYIISNEEIKDGDWCINKNRDTVYQIKDIVQGYNPNEDWNKVIATTNKLQILDKYRDDENNKFYLPQPSPLFIERFIEEYNKGNQIEEVLVEYEEIQTQPFYSIPTQDISQFNECWEEFVKVSKNDTITIKKVKDNYSRDKVVQLCKDAYHYGFRGGLYENSEMQNKEHDCNSINKWIKENL